MSALEGEIQKLIEPVVERVITRRLAELADRDTPGDDELLTAESAARLLGVSRWRLYDMVRRKVLPAVRPSERTIRIRRGDLRKFMRQHAR
jgi:excisionase family DNA binding protein